MASPYAVDPSDYSVKSYVQEGAMGKVFAAVRKSDGKRVAMKFFGYTMRQPSFHEMEKEIQLLISLRGIEGIVQLDGVFLDTADGMLPGKKHKGEFPVIVMEMIEGGELFDRINDRKSVSERDIAAVFRHTIEAIQSLHKRRFIHRDLKLENLMLVNKEENSKIKLIDFGMMIKLKPPNEIYTSGHLQGTAGYYAPESILYNEYSYKTDIWQAGCILYCMLSGLPPYNPRYPKQITHYSYIPMNGEGWDTISDLAKDLVGRILNKDKVVRLSCEQILNHPWMRGNAPSTNLGTDYFTRIKHLVLRQKFKTFFLENDIAADNKSRRSELELMLPFLRQASESSDKDDEVVNEAKRARTSSNVDHLAAFREKLVVLRTFMIEALLAQKSNRAQGRLKAAGEVETAPSGMKSSHDPSSPDQPVTPGEIDYNTFLAMLKKADLMELASPAVFNIFDIGKTRTIDLKEFLTTMLAFRPESADADAARLYFNIFDIRDNGYIDQEELRICLELLLLDDSCRNMDGGVPNVEEIFNAIDFTKSGSIDFNEFKTFYDTVLTQTNMTKSTPAKDVDRDTEPPMGTSLSPIAEEYSAAPCVVLNAAAETGEENEATTSPTGLSAPTVCCAIH